jgi:hypothetical protein
LVGSVCELVCKARILVLGGVEGVEARVFDQHQESSDLKLCESWSVCGVCLASYSWLRQGDMKSFYGASLRFS